MRRGGAQSAGCPKPTLVVRPTPGAGVPRFCGTIVRRFVTAFRSRNGMKISFSFERLVVARNSEVEAPLELSRPFNWLIRRVRG